MYLEHYLPVERILSLAALKIPAHVHRYLPDRYLTTLWSYLFHLPARVFFPNLVSARNVLAEPMPIQLLSVSISLKTCAEWAPRRVTRDAEMIEITCDLDQYKLPIGGVVVSVLAYHAWVLGFDSRSITNNI